MEGHTKSAKIKSLTAETFASFVLGGEQPKLIVKIHSHNRLRKPQLKRQIA
jgi:hypothetical protein